MVTLLFMAKISNIHHICVNSILNECYRGILVSHMKYMWHVFAEKRNLADGKGI